MADSKGLSSVNALAAWHDQVFHELRRGDLDRARDLFRQMREQVFGEAWSGFVPAVRVAGAALASAEGDHRRAAVLIGVADAAFARSGQVPDPVDCTAIAAVRESAVGALGAATFAAEFARGRALDPYDRMVGVPRT